VKKATRPIESFERVEVEWEDAYSSEDQHKTLDDAKNAYSPAVRKTIGYYVFGDERVVAVACEDDRQNDGAVSGVNYIPRGIVRSIRLACHHPSRDK
jgi:hypothetical protein